MNISFLSDKLQEKLSFLNHAVSSKSQLPVLLCFLLEAKDGKLNIYATDLEIGISTSITVSVEKEGRVVVPAKNITEIFSNLGSQKVVLQTEGETLLLKGNKIKASFQTMSSEDFPTLYEDKGEVFLSLSKEDIENKLSKIVFSAAIDSSRPSLSGVLIDEEKNEAIFVATDGYRLSLQQNALKTSQSLKKPLVVPARIIKELSFLKGKEDIKMFVFEKNNQVLFSQDETILVGRLIESEYPEYQKIIPTEYNTKTTINKEELLKAIKITSVFARESSNIIKFNIEKEKMIISANSPTVGEDMVEVDVKTTGESNEIAFNAKYLTEFLANISEEEVFFEMNGPLNPGVFKLKENPSFLHLIMPVRV